MAKTRGSGSRTVNMGMEPLEDMIKYCIYSGFLEGIPRPLSLLVVANTSRAKSSTVVMFDARARGRCGMERKVRDVEEVIFLSMINEEWKAKLDELTDDVMEDYELTGTTSRTFRVDTPYEHDSKNLKYAYEVTFKLVEVIY